MTGPAESSTEGGRTGGWVGALILIAIGLIFLFQNLGYHVPSNWWALFLLIPAVAAFAGAWRGFGEAGRVTASVAGSVLSGLVLVGLCLIFLFDLDVDWGLIWPAILILIGVGALARTYLR